MQITYHKGLHHSIRAMNEVNVNAVFRDLSATIPSDGFRKNSAQLIWCFRLAIDINLT